MCLNYQLKNQQQMQLFKKKKRKNGSGTITLIIANEEMNVMKILKPLEESGLLIEDVSQTIKNEAKKQKVGPLGMLLSTLGASL